MTANSRQVGGDHYRAEFQHWDLAVKWHLPYLEAQVAKYVTRCHKKNKRQDLEKALHFAEKAVECQQSPGWLGRVAAHVRQWFYPRSLAITYYGYACDDVEEYARQNNLDPKQRMIVYLCVIGCDPKRLVTYVRAYMHEHYLQEGDVPERVLWHVDGGSGFNGTNVDDLMPRSRGYVHQGD